MGLAYPYQITTHEHYEILVEQFLALSKSSVNMNDLEVLCDVNQMNTSIMEYENGHMEIEHTCGHHLTEQMLDDGVFDNHMFGFFGVYRRILLLFNRRPEF